MKMKKLRFWLLAALTLSLVLAPAACGPAAEQPAEEPPLEGQAPTPEPDVQPEPEPEDPPEPEPVEEVRVTLIAEIGRAHV